MNGSLRDDRGGGTGKKLLLAVALTILLDGCAVMSKLFSEPVAPGPEQITARIQEIESQLQQNKKADPEGALAHELALLYAHPANRAPDYGKSLAMIRTYRSLARPGAEDLETSRLAALLEEIEGLGRLLEESKTQEKVLSGQVQALLQSERTAKRREHNLRVQIRTLQELRGQIQALQARIEKIEALDMEIEKRRRWASDVSAGSRPRLMR